MAHQKDNRAKCFFIGYLSLIASVVDIGLHVITVSIVTNGLQCDVDKQRWTAIDISWLEPYLMMINLGTHGFYPYPMLLRNNAYIDYMPMPAEPKCYPGMFHVYVVDVLILLMNVIWFKFIVKYVGAVHKKDPESMTSFVGLSSLKLVLQVIFYLNQPYYHINGTKVHWYSVADILLSAILIAVMNKYIKQLRIEKILSRHVDQPPSYIECLIDGPALTRVDQKLENPQPEEQKVDMPVNVPAESPKP